MLASFSVEMQSSSRGLLITGSAEHKKPAYQRYLPINVHQCWQYHFQRLSYGINVGVQEQRNI